VDTESSHLPTFPGSVYEPVQFLRDGKQGYINAHPELGAPGDPNIDYSRIMADPVTGLEIADLYDKAPTYDPNAQAAYDQLIKETHMQYEYLTKVLGIKVEVSTTDPYKNVDELVRDIRENHHQYTLSTATTGGKLIKPDGQPIMTNEQNDEFRAVHDAFGHAASGRAFDRNGEAAAWTSHMQMFSPLAGRAVTTETHARNSVLIYGRPDQKTGPAFAAQKVFLLPPEYSDTSVVQHPRHHRATTADEQWMADRDNLYDETHCHHTSQGRYLPHARVEPGVLSVRDWTKWDEEHPWIKRFRPHGGTDVDEDRPSSTDRPRRLNPHTPIAHKPTPSSAEGHKGVPGVDYPIKTSNVREAATLLGQGKKVELKSRRQVSTLLDKLAAMVNDAERKGDKAPNYNLCNVSVPGTNLFCASSKGIHRVEMPQLSGIPTPGSEADKLPKDAKGEVNLADAFRQHLVDQGHKITDTTELASHLKASQDELKGPKVAGMLRSLRRNRLPPGRIFVSKDNYIVDGHHRWAAHVAHIFAGGKKNRRMEIARVDMPIIDLLNEANAYTERMGLPHQRKDRLELLTRDWKLFDEERGYSIRHTGTILGETHTRHFRRGPYTYGIHIHNADTHPHATVTRIHEIGVTPQVLKQRGDFDSVEDAKEWAEGVVKSDVPPEAPRVPPAPRPRPSPIGWTPSHESSAISGIHRPPTKHPAHTLREEDDARPKVTARLVLLS
jgi:hypothetical protein